ncbi:MAG TPA: hypothetical protein VF109_10160 [Mycobacteriales bacterium]
MDATTCPECGAPAEIVDRDALESTDGPMEHVKVICARRHWFLLSTRSLAAAHRRAAGVPAPRPAQTPAPSDRDPARDPR